MCSSTLGEMRTPRRSTLWVMATLLLSFVPWVSAPHASCDRGTRPPTPYINSAIPLSDKVIKIRWNPIAGVNYDISIREFGLSIGQDIGGGLAGRSEHSFYGLKPGFEYRIWMRARRGSGSEGCVSERASPTVVLRTPTTQVYYICRDYADRAVRQFYRNKAYDCGYTGPRWHGDKDVHFQACLSWRAAGKFYDQTEITDRDRAISRCAFTWWFIIF